MAANGVGTSPLGQGRKRGGKRKLLRETRFGVDWIYKLASQIAEKAA
jgi:hypothetical protein